MINRALFNHLLSYNGPNQRHCHGKNVTEYPELLAEMYYRQMLLTQQFTRWDAEKGLHWLIGFANYLNQNCERKTYPELLSRTYSFGDIIDVDFFGGFTNELTYDHPAIVLKNFPKGLMIAPITSNKSVYDNADSVHTHIKLPKNAPPLGYMHKDSTIKLEQTRYISKARVLRLKNRERTNFSTGVVFTQKQQVKETHKQNEIKEALIHIFAASLYYEIKDQYDTLQSQYDILENGYTEIEDKYNELMLENQTIMKQNEELLEENRLLKEKHEQIT